MTKKSKILFFSVVAIVAVIVAVFLFPKAAPEVQATIPVNFDIPLGVDSDVTDFQFIRDVKIYEDKACTQSVSDGTLKMNGTTNTTVSFAVTPDTEELYVKVPSYVTARDTTEYSVQLSDTDEVILEIDGKPCFKLSEITINQEVPKDMIASGGSILVVFEAIGKQYFHPGNSSMVIDGETYYGGFNAIYDVDEDTGEDICTRFSCMFMIPDDIEVDSNKLEIVFDSEYEIHQGFVTICNPNTSTK